jgi:hypothetical protein
MTMTFHSEAENIAYNQALIDINSLILRRQTALLYPHTQESSDFMTLEQLDARVRELNELIQKISELRAQHQQS